MIVTWPSSLYFLLSFIFRGKTHALHFLIPVIKDHIRKLDEREDEPVTIASLILGARLTDHSCSQSTVLEFLIRAAPPDEITDPHKIGKRLLVLEFGSIHTS
jgi:hypothetical protein